MEYWTEYIRQEGKRMKTLDGYWTKHRIVDSIQ